MGIVRNQLKNFKKVLRKLERLIFTLFFLIFFYHNALLCVLAEESVLNEKSSFYQKEKQKKEKRQTLRRIFISNHANELSHFLYQPKMKFNKSNIGVETYFSFSLHSMSFSENSNRNKIMRDSSIETVKAIYLRHSDLNPIYKGVFLSTFLYPITNQHAIGLSIQSEIEGNVGEDDGPKINQVNRYLSTNYLFDSSYYEASHTQPGVLYRGYLRGLEELDFHFGASYYLSISRKTNHQLLHILNDVLSSKPSIEAYSGFYYKFMNKKSFWILFSYKYFFNSRDSYRSEFVSSRNVYYYTEKRDFFDQFQTQPEYNFKVGFEMRHKRYSFRPSFNFSRLGAATFTHGVESFLDKKEKLFVLNFSRIKFLRKSMIKTSFGLNTSFYFSQSLLCSFDFNLSLPHKIKVLTRMVTNELREYEIFNLDVNSKAVYNMMLSLKLEL